MLGSWRRSLQLAFFNHRLISEVNRVKQVNWLTVDLGLREVADAHINEELDRMLIGFNRLFKYKRVKQATLGYFRMLDIQKDEDVYHPTIHILLPTIKSYFQGRYYIKYDEWLALWHKALDMDPENRLSVKVNVLNGRCDQQEAACKMEQFLIKLHDEPDRIPNHDTKLASRRLIGYSRLLKKETDRLLPEIEYNINQYDIHDDIANCAFKSMLHWYPGVRKQGNDPLHSVS
ncbi:protein rep [Paenibacillus azoreducens]|uniref:Replication protein n=1 Tax=Paenibacillus azoreducens TaxID=116718 RepID=A0A919YCE8_9BACL|nr:protein rep [Paenibacillus azoreducens]GIO48169.1 hypothetical protein J34TS1_29340 [Paenibacillus azoreducens]